MTFNAGHRKRDGAEYNPLEYIERRESLVRVRAGTGEVDAWKRCAKLQARSLSELMREAINGYVREALKDLGGSNEG